MRLALAPRRSSTWMRGVELDPDAARAAARRSSSAASSADLTYRCGLDVSELGHKTTYDKSAPVRWSTSFMLRPYLVPATDMTLTLTRSLRFNTSAGFSNRAPVMLDTCTMPGDQRGATECNIPSVRPCNPSRLTKAPKSRMFCTTPL